MSVQAMVWVLEQSGAKLSNRLVLLSLANHAGDENLAWPSVATIARESGCGERTVQAALRELARPRCDGGLGELEEAGTARKGTVIYRLLMSTKSDAPTDDEPSPRGADPAPPQILHPADPAPPPPQNPAQGGADPAPEPSKENVQGNQAAAAGARDPDPARLEDVLHIANRAALTDPTIEVSPPAIRATMLAIAGDHVGLAQLAVADLTSGRRTTRHFARVLEDRLKDAAIAADPPAGRGRRSPTNIQETVQQRRRANAGHCCLEHGAAPHAVEDEWKVVLEAVRQDLDVNTFEVWLEPGHAHVGADGELLAAYPPELAGWVADRHATRISSAAGRRIEIVICEHGGST